MSVTYLTTQELSEKIKYDPRTIRQQLKDSVLLEGRHYIGYQLNTGQKQEFVTVI